MFFRSLTVSHKQNPNPHETPNLMKIIEKALIYSPLAFLAIASTLSAELPLAENAARIIGDIPDGTPPPIEPPKPEFIVKAKDIIESKTYQQGGRKITVQQIKPIALPAPARRATSITPENPAIAESIEEFVEENPDAGFLFVGASVYRPKDGSPRTFVNLWSQGQGEGISFWSSADFALLSGFSSFIGSDGKSRSIMMAWDNQEIASLEELAATPESNDGLPKLLILAEGKATFSITSGKPSEETLAAIQSLHDLYNNEQPRLRAAYEGREKTRLAQEAELKAHPPKPKDLVLSFSRTETPTPAGKGTIR
jgi:hypothetical protein